MTTKPFGPAIIFYINGKFLIHSCDLSHTETYGDFLIYPHSHFEIWSAHYEKCYPVDFDYFPRGRVAYRKSDDTYLIYYDKCIEPYIQQLSAQYSGQNVILDYDEHYQCHRCNRGYVI